MTVDPFERYGQALREKFGLPAGWLAVAFHVVPGKGLVIRGAVCPTIQIGVRTGQPNWDARDRSTEFLGALNRQDLQKLMTEVPA